MYVFNEIIYSFFNHTFKLDVCTKLHFSSERYLSIMSGKSLQVARPSQPSILLLRKKLLMFKKVTRPMWTEQSRLLTMLLNLDQSGELWTPQTEDV